MFNQVQCAQQFLGLGYFPYSIWFELLAKYKGGAVHAQLKFSIVEFQTHCNGLFYFRIAKNVRTVNPPDTHRDKPLTAPNQ